MTLREAFSVTLSEYGLYASPRVQPADLDGDGAEEFVVYTVAPEMRPEPEDGEDDLIAIDSDGETVLWRTETGLHPQVMHHPWWGVAAGDIDGDGNAEVVHGISDACDWADSGRERTYADPEPGCLQVVDHDGETLWRSKEYHAVESVCLGDVDGDGDPEIVVAWQEPVDELDAGPDPANWHRGTEYGRYTVYRGDGTKLLDRRVGPTGPGPRFGHHTGLDMAPSTVDLDGAGRDLVLAPGGNRDAFRVIEHDGTETGRVRWSVPYEWHGDEHCVGDVDGDGAPEVALLVGEEGFTVRNRDGSEAWRVEGVGDHLQALGMGRLGDEGQAIYALDRGVHALHAFGPEGGHRWSADRHTTANASGFHVVDLDGDGVDEVVTNVRPAEVFAADGSFYADGVPPGELQTSPFDSYLGERYLGNAPDRHTLVLYEHDG